MPKLLKTCYSKAVGKWKRRPKAKVTEGIQALGRFLQRRGFKDFSELISIQTLWPGLVGPKIAKISFPTRLYRRELIIATKHPTWKQELEFHKADFVIQINEALKKNRIESIRIVIADFTPPETYKTKVELGDTSEDSEKYIQDVASEIKDKDIAESFQRAMRNNYRRKENFDD